MKKIKKIKAEAEKKWKVFKLKCDVEENTQVMKCNRGADKKKIDTLIQWEYTTSESYAHEKGKSVAV